MARRARVGAGVVWREKRGVVEVLVVHRRRRGDWVLPKGHVEGSETVRRAALREVREESGWRCSVLSRLCTTTRFNRYGSRRSTTYFEMSALDHRKDRLDGECDARRWVSVAEATELLTSASDRYALDWFHNRPMQ